MDAERARALLSRLPLVEETMNWGNNLVFWVGDKAVGGKMFALINLDFDAHRRMLSFSAGPERFHELLENDGVIPAPYMARIHWVALERWNAIPAKELETLLARARDLTYDKLPRRTKEILALPPREFGKVLAERKKLLAQKAEKTATAKTAVRSSKKSARKAASKDPTKPGSRQR